MRGVRAGGPPVSSDRVGRLNRSAAASGATDQAQHGRLVVARALGDHFLRLRATRGAIVRRVYALLIAAAVSIVLFQAIRPAPLAAAFGAAPFGALPFTEVVRILPAIAGGLLVGAALLVASASRAGLATIASLGMPGLTPEIRAVANGLAWASLATLAVHYTAAAFEALPGGHAVYGAILGGAFGFGTYRLHRQAIEHEAYRTFNLVAMLLAAGSLASMSITPTGDWWTRNFSTLGTSDDIAAFCFNLAVVVSGAGMAGLSGALTRALLHERYATRKGARATVRALIAVVGVSLMGVGLVPIDGDPVVHNVFASAAAVSFAVLCLGIRGVAASLPRTLVVFSYSAFAAEAVAAVLYEGLGLFNLTVFELIAFALVFAWLIALVATTATHEQVQTDVSHTTRRPLSAHPSRTRSRSSGGRHDDRFIRLASRSSAARLRHEAVLRHPPWTATHEHRPAPRRHRHAGPPASRRHRHGRPPGLLHADRSRTPDDRE